MGDGQPHHRPGRRLQVRPGRDDQAPDGFRHQDRHAARLHGRDRSLGVCRRHQGGQHPGVLREQAARGAAHDHEGSEQQGRAKPGLLVSAQAQLRRTGEGAHGPEDHFHRVEGKRQDRRREQSSRQVHRVLLVRVDVDAGRPQSAPQRLLPGLRQGTGLSLQLARLQSPHGTVELDGRAAQGGQRAARHLAQRQRQRRLDVPGRRRQHHRAADRRRLGGLARPQRAPGRDQAGQGTVGDASLAVAQRRVRQLRDVSGHPRPSGQRRPHRPHHGQLRAPGVQGRHRHAGHARLQPVQVRHGRRLRLAQHRQPVPPGQFLRPARRCGRDGRAALCRRTDRRHDGRAAGEPRRADRRVGRGEHPRFAVGRDVPQGNIWRQRPAHQGALLRRLGLQQGRPECRRLGEAVLRRRRADGRRPAAHAVGGRGRPRGSSSGP